MSTTAHGYHCAPTSTPTTFKETARSETSLAELTSGGRVVRSVTNPPFGGSPLSGAPPSSCFSRATLGICKITHTPARVGSQRCQKRLPITLETMENIKHALLQSPKDPDYIMVWAACCTGFLGFYAAVSSPSHLQLYLTLRCICS